MGHFTSKARKGKTRFRIELGRSRGLRVCIPRTNRILSCSPSDTTTNPLNLHLKTLTDHRCLCKFELMFCNATFTIKCEINFFTIKEEERGKMIRGWQIFDIFAQISSSTNILSSISLDTDNSW